MDVSTRENEEGGGGRVKKKNFREGELKEKNFIGQRDIGEMIVVAFFLSVLY